MGRRSRLLPLVGLAQLPSGPSSAGWFVDPATVKIAHDRRHPFGSSSQRVDLAGQRGECERAQIWSWEDGSDRMDVRVQPATLGAKAGGASFPAAAWEFKQCVFSPPPPPTTTTNHPPTTPPPPCW